MEQKLGLVFDFHRGTTHDGPGMRTTVFMKGCPLHCRWCQNPESINSNPEIQWTEKKCIGCKVCINCCQDEAIIMEGDKIKINKERCTNCFDCIVRCPAKALERVGRLWDVDALVKEVCKDHIFFENFNGGITISGGEPMLQHKFVTEVLKKLKSKKINTALDTSGYGKLEAFEQIYPYVDTFLYDIKFIDENKHIEYTTVSNKVILRNLKKIAELIRNSGGSKLWIRTPLIPEATATEENIVQIGDFIKRELIDVMERWELCTFNNICREKYKKLNIPWDYMETPLLTDETINHLEKTAKEFVGNKLVVSGLKGK